MEWNIGFGVTGFPKSVHVLITLKLLMAQKFEKYTM